MKICSRTSTWWVFFDLLSRIALNVQTFQEYYVNYISDVSIKEKRVYPPQQTSQSNNKYTDLRQHANKYKQVVLETISWMFNGIQRVTYVTWAVK